LIELVQAARERLHALSLAEQLRTDAKEPGLRRQCARRAPPCLLPLGGGRLVGRQRQRTPDHLRPLLEGGGFGREPLMLRPQIFEHATLSIELDLGFQTPALGPRQSRQHPGMLMRGDGRLGQQSRLLRVAPVQRLFCALFELERMSVRLGGPGFGLRSRR
jgi:hypothetical protein